MEDSDRSERERERVLMQSKRHMNEYYCQENWGDTVRAIGG